MTNNVILTAGQKALQINLDLSIYGSFVETGAGQEVARNFFRVRWRLNNNSKNNVCMVGDFSAAIYGKVENNRYVCKERLQKMLDHEYTLLNERLDEENIGTLNHFLLLLILLQQLIIQKQCKVMVGLELDFKLMPDEKPSDFIIHVILNDQDARLQQETVGIIE